MLTSQSEEAEEEDSKSNDEDDKSRYLIIVTLSISLEEGGTGTCFLVATNKTDLGAGLDSGGLVAVGAVNGVEGSIVSSLGDSFDDLLLAIITKSSRGATCFFMGPSHFFTHTSVR